MSKSRIYKNRLNELFSDTGPVDPDPTQGESTPAHDTEPSHENEPDTLENFTSETQTRPQDPGQIMDSPPSQIEASPSQAETSEGVQMQVGWEDYLDGINRTEHLGFVYDPSKAGIVKEMSATELLRTTDLSSQPNLLKMPLAIGGEIIGGLVLEREAEDQAQTTWSLEEEQVVHNVANRIVQQIENLRLLEQAERYRSEAVEAVRRMTREGWENYLNNQSTKTNGFVYDLDQVKPLGHAAIDPFSMSSTSASSSNVATRSLRIRDEMIGQISVSGLETEDRTATNILESVSNRLSAHIENLRLFEETELSRQQLDRRAAELETVARVSTAAATILSPQELMQSVVDLTKYSFNLYHTQIFLVNETNNTLVLRAGAGKLGYKMVSQGQIVPIDQGNSVIVQVARSRTGVINNDLWSDPDRLIQSDLPDAHSEIAVPLVVGDQLLGIFDALANSQNRFNESDMQIYITLASQVAVALRNAELYAEQIATVARLRELDHLKSSFLANMSHELRTPLNSILGFTQVVMEGLDGPLTENMFNDLGLVEKNGKHLLTLINDVLDMAKVEAGRLSLNPEAVNLKEILADVFESASGLLNNKSLYMKIENDEEMDITLLMDRTRMRQVFVNLIGNAVKFTETGGVVVSVEKTPRKIYIKFKDTGIGIPPEKLEAIFEAFTQVDTSTTRKAGGTGLGLPISRRLVELHGGHLWAESEGIPGKGSILVLELPVTTPL